MCNNHRILFNISMPHSKNPEAAKKATITYLKIGNILSGTHQLPNISDICDFCNEKEDRKLSAYIRNKCLDIKSENTLFYPPTHTSNGLFNGIESFERKNIRILLYPGQRSDIADLNMQETTHNMIIQFQEKESFFNATESHRRPPSFYQVCSSEDVALLYVEALIIDACMCHYLSISDVAYHLEDKKKISSEKVSFLLEICKNNSLDFLTPSAQNCVKYVTSKLSDDTPYISFLSIFTIASQDINKEISNPILAYFADYCKLWKEFQKWYFKNHGRMFSKLDDIGNPLNSIFVRNKYQGQISPSVLEKKIKEKIKSPVKSLTSLFELENRYAIIIIKHTPNTPSQTIQLDPLFSGTLRQAKWTIVHWNEVDKYINTDADLEVVPFIINE